MDTFLEITKAKYLGDYRIRLWFNNGEIRVVDLDDSLDRGVFTQLRDKSYFQRFSIPFNTIEWENGADFAPEYLYEHGVRPDDADEESPLPCAAEEGAVYGSAALA